jgi:hypothetical protein
MKHKARAAFPVVATIEEELPANSVVAVYEGASSGIPCEILGTKVGFLTAGSPLGLFTNDSVSVEAGGKILLRPINDYDPVLLRVIGETPQVGRPCGPALDTWGITADMLGFVCLSEPIDMGGSGSDEFVWVMRTGLPTVLIGAVSTAPPGYSGSGEEEAEYAISSGLLMVLYRDANQTSGSGADQVQFLDFAPGPDGSTPWLVPFWARGFSSGMPATGDIIEVHSTIGVGFLHVPEGSGGSGGSVNAWLGKTVAQIDIDSIGEMTIYTGAFPNETSGDDMIVVNRFGCVSSGQWVAALSLSGCTLPYLIAARCTSGSGA